MAFRAPGGHWRVEVGEFRRFLKEYGMPPLPVPSPDTRILVVDDEPRVVDVIVASLARDPRGFKVEAATDGYEALIKVGAFKPSLLILDVAMPRVDGVEVCRRIKAEPETRTVKILGITGYPDTIPAMLEAGADACLIKPLDLQQLHQELDRLVSSPRA